MPAEATVAALGHGLVEDADLATSLTTAGVRVLDESADVPTFLSAADIYVLTSAWEGFPLAVLEAMRASLPVVAYQVGGVAEQVRDNETGRIVEAGDTLGLAQAVRELVRQPALRKRFGARGREVFEERFTLEQMVDGIEETYSAVLERTTVA